MTHVHTYRARSQWSGSTGAGYEAYDRRHHAVVLDASARRHRPPTTASADIVASLELSGDPAFGGDAGLLNPEQLLVLAASSCQLLSFLAVAARARLDVVRYLDEAEGEMPDTTGRTGLTRILLRPVVTLRSGSGVPTAERFAHLVEVAHRECYIANSLSTPVTVEPTLVVED